jgi:hypothetical protein
VALKLEAAALENSVAHSRNTWVRSKQSFPPPRKATPQKISRLVKCTPPNSGDRGVKQKTMKANDADFSEGSQREFQVDDLEQAALRELSAGVLKQAAQDLRRFRGATSKIERELYLDAYRWLTANKCSSPFSFLNICQLLNLAPDDIRHELVGDASLGALSYRTRRCGRAAGRLSASFSHFFVNERNCRAETGDMVFNNASSAAGAFLHENVN